MMLVIATCAGFTSCGDDDDDDDPDFNALIGEWKSIDGNFYLLINSDGTGIIREDGYVIEGEYKLTDSMIAFFYKDDYEPIYYRLKGGKLYIYYDREDLDLDDPAYICEKIGNGEGSDKPETGATNDLCHTWVMEGYIPGEGHYRSSMTFKSDGTCFISEQAPDPEDSYTATVNYSIEGDLSNGATLKLWGKTVDGDFMTLIYIATISSDGKTLGLIGIGGEAEGDDYKLTRQ